MSSGKSPRKVKGGFGGPNANEFSISGIVLAEDDDGNPAADADAVDYTKDLYIIGHVSPNRTGMTATRYWSDASSANHDVENMQMYSMWFILIPANTLAPSTTYFIEISRPSADGRAPAKAVVQFTTIAAP